MVDHSWKPGDRGWLPFEVVESFDPDDGAVIVSFEGSPARCPFSRAQMSAATPVPGEGVGEDFRTHFGNVLNAYAFGAYKQGEAVDKLVELISKPFAALSRPTIPPAQEVSLEAVRRACGLPADPRPTIPGGESVKRFTGGQLAGQPKPYLSPEQYDALREDDKFLYNRITPQPLFPIPKEAEAGVGADAMQEARFLVERLKELECEILDDEVGRQYYGHVAPSRARLEAALNNPLTEEER